MLIPLGRGAAAAYLMETRRCLRLPEAGVPEIEALSIASSSLLSDTDRRRRLKLSGSFLPPPEVPLIGERGERTMSGAHKGEPEESG